jgi:spoIIIJ-associated protein
MSEATFEAATVEAAREKAATELGVAEADLEHEVIEEKQDFWGGEDSTVVIKAWSRAVAEPEAEGAATEVAPQEAPAEPVEADVATPDPEERAAAETEAEAEPAEPAEAAEPAQPAQPAEAAEAAEHAGAEATGTQPPEAAEVAPADAEAEERPGDTRVEGESVPGVEPEAITALLAQIFHDMEFDCTIEIEAEGDGYLATIAGDDKEALLEGNGRCLSALELIVNNAFRHKLPRGSKVSVDAGDFRSRRDEELSDLAYQVAHSAKETGKTQETQPLNPYERRLIHLALAEDPGVSTRSRGSGFLKNVQIIPQDGGHGGRGRGRGR